VGAKACVKGDNAKVPAWSWAIGRPQVN